jgi:hypothetical protein
MPSTDRKLELKAKTSVAQTVSQPAVYAKWLLDKIICVYENGRTYRCVEENPPFEAVQAT